MIVALVCCVGLLLYEHWSTFPKGIAAKVHYQVVCGNSSALFFVCCICFSVAIWVSNPLKDNVIFWSSFIKQHPPTPPSVVTLWHWAEWKLEKWRWHGYVKSSLTGFTKGRLKLSPHIYTSSVDSSALFQLLSPKSTTPGSKCVLAYSLKIHCWFSNIISIIITVKPLLFNIWWLTL